MLAEQFEHFVRLAEGTHTIVHRARRRIDGHDVILKVLKPVPSQEWTARHLRREHELGRQVAHAAILSPLEFIDGSEPALVLPDTGGISTLELVRDGPLPTERAVRIGIAISEALAALHAGGLLHGDVSPANILHCPTSGGSWLIDFSHAHRRGRQPLPTGRRSASDFLHCSPERTGRTAQSIDERSDLYSLGASLYHLLTGRPPFVGSDALQIVHAHLARTVPSALTLRPDLPEDLDAVLRHCLQKSPDDRYQSAEGLRRDLLACLRRRRRQDRSAFHPGRQDVGARPSLTELLVGREPEVALLRRAFEAVAGGRSRLVCVRGWAGIGKSRLVAELMPWVTASGGTWISGKHELLGRGVPYRGLAEALARWSRTVLSDPAEPAARIRDRALAALGDQAGVLTGLIPELELLLGAWPLPSALPAAETEGRIRVLLQQLFVAIARPRAPLVLFLDDLQWADAASLQVLKPMLTQPSSRHVLVVGAWRNPEVGSDHPLTGLLAELRGQGAQVEDIVLGPLSSSATLEFVARSLRSSPEPLRDLAGSIYAATGGSPFYVGRLLTGLWEDGAIRRTGAGIRWNRDAISLEDTPADAVLFLQERLRRLPPPVQRALTIGAWLGSRFSLLDVARILGSSPADVAPWFGGDPIADLVLRVDDSPLELAQVAEGLDPSLSPAFRFLHDRVQQAAAELPPSTEIPGIRLAIARHLAGGDARCRFEAVDHALNAAEVLQDPGERRRFAGLAATAGRRAMAAAAFDLAHRIFEAGIAWGGDGLWDLQPDLALDLALGAAETSYLDADRSAMERHVARVLHFSRDPLARLRAEEIAALAHVAANEIGPAIDRVAAAVGRIGGGLNPDPGMAGVLLGLWRVRWALRGRHPHHRLRRLPICGDPLALARRRLESALFSPAFYGRPRLFPVLAFRMVRDTLRSGISPDSCIALLVYGIVLASMGDIRAGMEHGRTALELRSRLSDPRLRYRSEHIWNAHLRFWSEPWHACRDDLSRIHRGCWQSGDVEYAAFAAFMSCTLGLHTGERLEILHERNGLAIESIRSLGQQTSLHTTRMHHQIIENLLGRSADPLQLRGSAYDEAAMERVHQAAGDHVNLHCLAVSRAYLFLFFDEMPRAAHHMRRADAWDWGVRSQPLHVIGRFIDALAHAAIGDRRRAGRRLADLRRWRRHGEINLAHRVSLVEAELAAHAGDGEAASRAWESAIHQAERHGFPHERGLALHRAARFHTGRGRTELGRLCFLEAHRSHSRWGAVALVEALERRNPAHGAVGLTAPPVPRPERREGGSPLDLEALLEAARRIAGEVTSTEVTSTLLETIVVLAGASSAILWRHEDQLFLEALRAVTSADGVDVRYVTEAPPLGSPLLAEARRLAQPITVAFEDETRRRDPCFRGEEVQSALAVPVTIGGAVKGVVLLLHHQLKDAFPSERVAPLQALAAQAGIALENALHYEELDSRVRQRTAELIAARREAEAERDRADRLLRNALPEPIASELKRYGRARPISVEAATVLFTDFVGFSQVASTLSPEDLVMQLERCFGAFDDIIDRHGITKLKTIGDGYMAVGGLPEPDPDHALHVVRAALDIAAWVEGPTDDLPRPPFQVRIGVHSGPLVAGVIGTRRLLYDVWGDTVNLAARLEETGEPGRVNISQATLDRIGSGFSVQPRGLVPVKGRGVQPMYFVGHGHCPAAG